MYRASLVAGAQLLGLGLWTKVSMAQLSLKTCMIGMQGIVIMYQDITQAALSTEQRQWCPMLPMQHRQMMRTTAKCVQ